MRGTPQHGFAGSHAMQHGFERGRVTRKGDSTRSRSRGGAGDDTTGGGGGARAPTGSWLRTEPWLASWLRTSTKAGARPRSRRGLGSPRCQPTTAALRKCVDNLAAERSGPGSGSRLLISTTGHAWSIAGDGWSKQTSFGSTSRFLATPGWFILRHFREFHHSRSAGRHSPLRVREARRWSAGGFPLHGEAPVPPT